ncbi:MAG: hypothetical protein RIT40_823 [Planctomycetota bacterium]
MLYNARVSEPRASVTSRRRSAEHWVVLCLVLGAFAVEVWLGLRATPDGRGFGTHEQLGLPPCRAMDWFGVPCPGCGVTTSVTHAVQLDLASSFDTQPFGLLVALAIPLMAAWALWTALRGGDCSLLLARWTSLPLVTLVAAAAAFGWIWKLGSVF